MSRKIRVILDTSSLRNESGIEGPGLRQLAEISQAEVVEVCLPVIVERELCGGLADDFTNTVKQQLRDVRKATNWMGRGADRDAILTSMDVLKAAADRCDELVGTGVSEWIEQIGATRIDITEQSAKAAWETYFEGRPPMAGRRSRKDLPDAFILAEVVRSLASGLVHVVASDKRLRDACKAAGATVHENVGAFVTCEEVKTAVRAASPPLRDPEFWLSSVLGILARDRTRIGKMLEAALLDALPGREIQHSEFPSDNQDATISTVGEVEDITFEEDKIEDLGEGRAIVPATIRLEAGVDLYVFKGDYFSMSEADDDVYSLVDPDWNEHFVSVVTTVTIDVDCVIRLELAQDTGDTQELVSSDIEAITDVEVTSIAGRGDAWEPEE